MTIDKKQYKLTIIPSRLGTVEVLIIIECNSQFILEANRSVQSKTITKQMIINRITHSILNLHRLGASRLPSVKQYAGLNQCLTCCTNRQMFGSSRRFTEKEILKFQHNLQTQDPKNSKSNPQVQWNSNGQSSFPKVMHPTNFPINRVADTYKNAMKNLQFKNDSLPLPEVIVNTKKLSQLAALLFNQNQHSRFIAQIKDYLHKINRLDQQQANKAKHKEVDRVFFINILSLLNQAIENQECCLDFLKLLVQSDIKALKQENFKKFYATQDQESLHNSHAYKDKIDLVFSLSQRDKRKQKVKQHIYNKSEQQSSEIHYSLNHGVYAKSSNQILNVWKTSQIQQPSGQISKSTYKSLQNANRNVDKQSSQHHNKVPSYLKKTDITLSAAKLFIKKAPADFQIKEESFNEIDRRLFKNQKIVDENVVLKKSKKNPEAVEAQRVKFGQNWVYAYEMPYKLQTQYAQKFIDHIQSVYGKLLQFVLFPYRNMLQHERQQITYVIPDMISPERSKKENRIQRNVTFKPVPSLTEQHAEQKALRNKTMSDKILQKIRKQKQFKLNKSSMLLKFVDKTHKLKLLSPQIRLFGVNLGYFNNIRMEEAQSKNFVALSMLPWGCSSQDLIYTLNKALKPLNITLTYPHCILAKSYLFIQLQNFFQSFHAIQLLNNLQFQDQHLKAQIAYGSSESFDGRFKSTLQFDHYETLVKKLKEVHSFYSNYDQQSKQSEILTKNQ